MLRQINLINWLLIVISTLLIILFMHPFLKYPFDMYHHLLWINDYYTNTTLPNDSRFFWHYFWSKIFYILHLDNSKLFERAYIIHYTQTIISYFSIYYFSFTISKFIIPKTKNKLSWHTIAAIATLIWITIYATASVGYHLVWIQWYSINYQITLPLTFLSFAFLLNTLFNKNTKLKYIYTILLLITTLTVLIIHSAEFVYFLMYLSLLSIIYIDKIFIFLNKNKIITVLIFIGLLLILFNLDKIISLISYRTPKLLVFILNSDFKGLWEYILKDGNTIIHLFNRAKNSFNELMIVSLFLTIPTFLISLKLRKANIINFRLVLLLIISSYFVLIPLYQISAGIASILTYKLIVNRFYYSSTIFLIVPIFSYLVLLLFRKEKNLLFLSLLSGIIVLSTFLYSRYAIDTQQNYYKNIQSIKNAWNERKVGFNLSNKEIEYIGQRLKEYETKFGKNLVFYAREDIAFVIKYIYNKNAYLPIRWRGNKLDKDFYIKAYQSSKVKQNSKILFKTPKNFPNYKPYR